MDIGSLPRGAGSVWIVGHSPGERGGHAWRRWEEQVTGTDASCKEPGPYLPVYASSQAVRMFDKLSIPLCPRTFPSGLTVVQTTSHSDEQVRVRDGCA